MTKVQALKYVVDTAAKEGYYDLSFEATYEIYEMIEKIEDCSKENLEDLMWRVL